MPQIHVLSHYVAIHLSTIYWSLVTTSNCLTLMLLPAFKRIVAQVNTSSAFTHFAVVLFYEQHEAPFIFSESVHRLHQGPDKVLIITKYLLFFASFLLRRKEAV